ncbi:MAG: helix-turn-helix domain-containing protein [Lachnospiraceae bacterium]|nr:helix-turn-helix domain-containing protein [Lachnospiraceae bacterium]
MAKLMDYDTERVEELCELGKALSSPVRVEILRLLYDQSLIIGEIAKEMNLPASSTAFHLKILEQAGLVRMEEQPGTRGTMKLCTRKTDFVTINLVKKNTNINEIFSMEMPVGAYSGCNVTPTCGLCGADGIIGNEDKDYCFFFPERYKAGLLWSSSGYVEYKFANGVPKNRRVKRISVCMEICSEAPGYREDWKSDLTLWINGVECGTWTCPGDYGARRGRLTPVMWTDGATQYGLQVVWEVREDGCYLNGKHVSQTGVESLALMEKAYVAVRIGNKPDARYIGGFNIFGKGFGDYDQDIVLTMEY